MCKRTNVWIYYYQLGEEYWLEEKKIPEEKVENVMSSAIISISGQAALINTQRGQGWFKVGIEVSDKTSIDVLASELESKGGRERGHKYVCNIGAYAFQFAASA